MILSKHPIGRFLWFTIAVSAIGVAGLFIYTALQDFISATGDFLLHFVMNDTTFAALLSGVSLASRRHDTNFLARGAISRFHFFLFFLTFVQNQPIFDVSLSKSQV